MRKEVRQSDVIEEIRKQAAETSQRQVAKRIGITPAYLSDILFGRREISERIALAFGFEKKVVTTVKFTRRQI